MSETTTQQKKDTASKTLAVLVVVLLAVVCAQSILLFKAYGGSGQPLSLGKAKPTPDVAQTKPEQPPARPRFDPDDTWWSGLDNWDPFVELQRMHERMNRLFDDSISRFRLAPGFAHRWPDLAFSPRLDLRETADQYVVRMDIPGVDKANLSVGIDDRVLTVSGRVDEASESKNGQMLRRERRSGQFQRSVTLPGPVQADAMTAKYEDGILTVTIPKKKDTGGSRRITIL